MSGSIHLLHHKSWHVWSKDNVARIEKDERDAKDKEAKLKAQAIDAERESRYERISKKRKREAEEEAPNEDQNASPTNINFFADLERQEEAEKSKPGASKRRKVVPHPEAESERKAVEEREEQQWTSYLGKDSIEKMKVKPWWFTDGPAPQLTERRAVFERRSKILNDPLQAMNRYIDETANPVTLQVLEDPELRERMKKKKPNVWRRDQGIQADASRRQQPNITDGIAAIKEMEVKKQEKKGKKKKDKKDKDKKHKKHKKRQTPQQRQNKQTRAPRTRRTNTLNGIR